MVTGLKQWLIGCRKKIMDKLAHLWLGFEGALLIVANKSFDSFALVIRYALEEFSSEVCVPQN